MLLVPGGALIAAIVVSSVLTSVWLWLYLTVRYKFCSPELWLFFTLVREMWGLQHLGVGAGAHFYLRSSSLSPLAKPQAKLQTVW